MNPSEIIDLIVVHSTFNHAISSKGLCANTGEFSLYEKSCVYGPSLRGGQKVVGLEYEDRKTQKLIKVDLDGLIYICDSGRLSETIRLLYQSKLLAQSQRIKRYGEHFFLFSDCLDGGGPELPRLLNAAAKPVRLADWCGYLQSTKWTKRRDEEF